MGNKSTRKRRVDLSADRDRPQPSAPDPSLLSGLLAEVLPRTEREQQLGAVREEGVGLRSAAQPIGIFLPEVCHRHNSRLGCTDPDCRRLHLCRLFLADICRYRSTCHKGHSLTTVHNEMVCRRHQLDTTRELVLLQQLRRAFDEGDKLPDAIYRSNLERCFRYSSRFSCLGQDECKRIHICRDFVMGHCRRTVCQFGHDLHTTHNNGVLSRHRVTRLPDSEILKILREKEPEDTRRATAAVSSVRHGAMPQGMWRPSRGPSGPSRPSRGLGRPSRGLGRPSRGPSQPSRGPSQPSRRPSQPRRGSGQPSRGSGQPSRGLGQNSPTGSGDAGREASAPEGLSDELQCPVCLDMFNTATTLGCGHTFCAECLQRLRDHNGDLCPMCREPIESATRSVALDNIVRSMAAAEQ